MSTWNFSFVFLVNQHWLLLIKPHCLIHGLPDGFVGCDSLVFVVFVCLLFCFLVKLKELGSMFLLGLARRCGWKTFSFALRETITGKSKTHFRIFDAIKADF